MRDSVPSPRYSLVCNVLRQWKTSLIPTYRVYRLYDIRYPVCHCYRKKVYIQFVLALFNLKVLHFNYFNSTVYFYIAGMKKIYWSTKNI